MLIKKSHIRFVFILTVVFTLNDPMSAQLPEFKTLDLGGNETGLVYSLSNGGFAVIGETDQSGDDDVFLIRLDSNLDVLSSIEIGDASQERVTSLIELDDDTLLLTGMKNLGLSPSRGLNWLARISSSGVVDYYENNNNHGQDRMPFLLRSSFSGKIYNYGHLEGVISPIAGTNNFNRLSISQFAKPSYISSLVSNWNNFFDQKAVSVVDDWGEVYAREAVEDTVDGSLAVLAIMSIGKSNGMPAYPFQEPRVFNIDSNGNLLSITRLDSIQRRTNVWAMCETLNGGYIVCGNVSQGVVQNQGTDLDICLYRLDNNFNIIWTKTMGRGGDDDALDIVHLGNDEYLIAGYVTDIGIGGKDACMIKINSSGDIIWARAYGDAAGDEMGEKVVLTEGTDTTVHIEATTFDSIMLYIDDSLLVVNDTLAITIDTISIASSLTTNQVIIDTLVVIDTIGTLINIDTLIALDTFNLDTFNLDTFNISNVDTIVIDTVINQLYLLSGTSNSYGLGDDVYIVRTDSSGGDSAKCVRDIKDTLIIQNYTRMSSNITPYPTLAFPSPPLTSVASSGLFPIIEKQCIPCDTLNLLSFSDTCLNDSTFFYVNNLWADSLFWDFGDGDSALNNNPQAHLYDSSGIYNAILISENDSLACYDTAFVEVEVYALPEVNAGLDTAICPGDTVLIGDALVNGSSYSWQSTNNLSAINISDPLAFPLADESFIVTETDSNGCTDIDTIAFVVHPLPDLSLDDTILICNGDTVQLSTLGGSNYSWSPVNILNNANISSPLVFPDSTILVYVSFQDSINGCPGNDSVYFNVNYFDSISVSGTDTICLGDTAYLFATGSDSCWWNSGIMSNAIQSTPLTTSEYLVWSNNMCGSDTDTFVVTVVVPPVADAGSDQVINYGESGSLQGQGGISYMWSPSVSLDCPDCQNTNASPLQSTIYTLMVTDSFGCVGIDSMFLELKYKDTLFVPNLFSPNGDGHNDILYVRTFGIFENIHFRLYNRWGKMVFETYDENIGWDGYYNGVMQPLDVYVYYLVGNTLDDKIIKQKGDIILMR